MAKKQVCLSHGRFVLTLGLINTYQGIVGNNIQQAHVRHSFDYFSNCDNEI